MDFSPVADAIIESTDLSMLAWECNFAAAMAERTYRYLRLNRCRMEVYEEFAMILAQRS